MGSFCGNDNVCSYSFLYPITPNHTRLVSGDALASTTWECRPLTLPFHHFQSRPIKFLVDLFVSVLALFPRPCTPPPIHNTNSKSFLSPVEHNIVPFITICDVGRWVSSLDLRLGLPRSILPRFHVYALCWSIYKLVSIELFPRAQDQWPLGKDFQTNKPISIPNSGQQ